MMPVATPGSGEWRNLPDAQLEKLTNLVGKGAIRFTSYKTRERPEPESQAGIVTRPSLYEGLVEVEGQRFRAEYIVSGQIFSSGESAEPRVEAIPLEWEDKGNPSTPAGELDSLTLAVLEAHGLLTMLASHD